MNDSPDKIAFSTAEACFASGVGKTKLFAALGSGDLKSRLIGRKRIILREDLLEWLRGQPSAVSSSPETSTN